MTEKIAAIVPALNAAPSIARVVRESLAAISPVVVINDGSTDATEQEARAAGAVVLRHEVNRGKGAALKTGFRWALENGFDAVVTLDADGQHLPSEIPKFLRARAESGADLIIGDRSRLFGGMVVRRQLANRFSAWSISIAAGARVPDTQSGFRLYSGNLLRNVRLRSDGFAAESEAIVRAGRAKLKIEMLPIDLGFVDGVSTSHYRPILDTLRIAIVVARTRLFG